MLFACDAVVLLPLWRLGGVLDACLKARTGNALGACPLVPFGGFVHQSPRPYRGIRRPTTGLTFATRQTIVVNHHWRLGFGSTP